MTSAAQQFTGINAPDGFVNITLGAGWNLLSSYAALPAGATGVVIVGPGAWSWCVSPEATTADPTLAGLPVQAGNYLALVGRPNLEQLVIQGAGTLYVQYTYGAVGKMPILPNAGTGGGGGGTVMSVTGPWIDNTDPTNPVQFTNWENVIWVTKSGNDTTGQRNRIDLPFLTITAAEAAAVAGDVIMVGPGVYNEQRIGQSGTMLTFYGFNAVIEPLTSNPALETGSGQRFIGNWTFTANSWASGAIETIGGECEIHATINAVSNGNAVVLVGSGTNLIFHGTINSSAINAVEVPTGSSLTMYGDINAPGQLGVDVFGTFTLHGNITADAGVQNFSGGTSLIYGDINAAGGVAVLGVVGHNCTIYGNVTSTGAIAADCQGGRMVIYGTVTSNADNAALCQAGVIEVYGDCIGTATGAAARCTNGRLEVFGNAIGTDAGFSTGAVCSGGTLVVHGNAEARSTSASIGVPGARCFGTGTLVIMGNVTSANSRGLDAEDGDTTVYGEIIGNSTFGTARAGVVVQDGNVWIGKGARNATGNPPAILFQGGGLSGVVTLSGGCYLGRVGGIGANAIQGTSGTVRNYGGFSSNAIAGTITVVGPAITILP